MFCGLTIMWLEQTNSYLFFSDWCFLYLENGFVHQFWESLRFYLFKYFISSILFISFFLEFLLDLHRILPWVLPNYWLFFLIFHLFVTVLHFENTLKSPSFNSVFSVIKSTVEPIYWVFDIFLTLSLEDCFCVVRKSIVSSLGLSVLSHNVFFLFFDSFFYGSSHFKIYLLKYLTFLRV